MSHNARLVFATARKHGPGDTGEFVGESDREQVALKSLRCLRDPRPQALPCRARSSRQDEMGSLHEQRPQVLVAALGDLAEDRATAGRLLPRYQPEPSGEVASLPEAGALANRRDDGARDDRPDPRYRHQTLAGSVLLR